MKKSGGKKVSKMCRKEILINGVKATVNVPDSLLVGGEKSKTKD